MMSVGAIAVAAVTWALLGYSLAFDGDASLIGGLNHVALHDVGFAPREGTTIPQLVFMAFQATFCIITVALVSGAVVERMRFGAFLVFAALWSIVVYAVLAHWAFGGGWLAANGTLDFAGGVPVEMGAGFSALAAALVVRARKDYGRQALLPHNAVFVLLGAGLLWFGWFGFNGGSGFSTGNNSVLAFTNTLLTPACSLVVWFILDLVRGRRVTAIGAATAIIVGCVLITPAGGFISPAWAMLLGAAGAVPCYAVVVYRPRTRVDETLDVLAAHGIAGFVGILFIGFVAQFAWNGVSDGLFYGNASQLGDQAIAAAVAPAYAFGVTYLLLRVIGFVMPLRATERQEALGMDVVQHGEEAYATGEGAILVSPESGVEAEVAVKPI
jgi:Amt family ammonium transporter